MAAATQGAAVPDEARALLVCKRGCAPRSPGHEPPLCASIQRVSGAAVPDEVRALLTSKRTCARHAALATNCQSGCGLGMCRRTCKRAQIEYTIVQHDCTYQPAHVYQTNRCLCVRTLQMYQQASLSSSTSA